MLQLPCCYNGSLLLDVCTVAAKVFLVSVSCPHGMALRRHQACQGCGQQTYLGLNPSPARCSMDWIEICRQQLLLVRLLHFAAARPEHNEAGDSEPRLPTTHKDTTVPSAMLRIEAPWHPGRKTAKNSNSRSATNCQMFILSCSAVYLQSFLGFKPNALQTSADHGVSQAPNF